MQKMVIQYGCKIILFDYGIIVWLWYNYERFLVWVFSPRWESVPLVAITKDMVFPY